MVKMNNLIDLPLSEIISQKKINLNRQKHGAAASGGTQKAKQFVTKPVIQRAKQTNIGDVRNHLIQKKRTNITDAREQLAKLAKTGDVRDKLNKIRKISSVQNGAAQKKPLDMRQKLNTNRGNVQVKKNVNQQQQNKSQKTIRVAGNSGQTRLQGTSLVRTVTGSRSNTQQQQQPRQQIAAPIVRTIAVKNNNVRNGSGSVPVRRQAGVRQNRLGPANQRARPVTKTVAVPRQQMRQTIVQQTRPRQMQVRSVPAPQNTVYVRQQPQPVYREIPSSSSYRPRQSNARARLEPLHPQRTQYVIEEEYVPPPQPRPTVVYRQARRPQPPTVVYDYEVPQQFEEYVDEPVYYGDQTDSFYTPEFSNAQEVYVPPPARSHQQYGPPAPPAMQQRQYSYVSQQNRPMRHQPQQQQQNIRRSAPVIRQNQVSRPIARPPQSPKIVGHKVSVGNLRAATREDIEELFGNIGPISSCNMIRSDTAVVVFQNVNDAKKSVEVYHNRKLDNHPMHVKIIGTVTENTPMRNNRTRVY